jgi:N-acylneuraminate cytidylyltransferase
MIVTSGTEYLAVIPARGGSKGVRGKNLRPLAGRPLVAWTVDHVRRCARPIRVVVSTDDPAIAAVALESGAEVHGLRPACLSGDDAPTEPVLIHALDTTPECDSIRHVLLLQPTSPIRDDTTIDKAIEHYESTRADSLVAVTEILPFIWKGRPDRADPLYDINARPRRQDIGPAQRRFAEHGTLYITAVEGLRASGNRLCGQVAMYVLKPHEGLDIDTEFDLWLAERWLEAPSC